jgi:SPX domain protein involved in polyphosphate accumulation
MFSESYNARHVNTIYFDDTNYSSISENLDGLNYKKKYRLRWYGNSEIISKPQFEIKSKIGLITKKETLLPETIEDIKFDYDGLEKISNIFLKEIKINKILFPVLSTHYLRYYFISSNKHVRATFDKNLKSYQLSGYKDLSFKKDFNNSIFEIKYDKKYDNYVKQNLKNISLRISKSSKYVISSLDQPVSFS